MLPLLFKIGPIPIHTYGVMIAIGFLLAISIAKRLALRSRIDPDKLIDLMFWSLIVGFAGSRILFVITRLHDFAAEPLAVFRVWEGGLVFLGAPIAVVPFVAWFLRKHKMPTWSSVDAIVPGVTIAHALGRVGCLASGCCYGKPTELPWGVRLDSEIVEMSMRGIPLHPTQLYEAAALTILFFGLMWVHRRRAFDGQVALTYFMAYPILRSIIEVFRGDLIRGFVIDGILSTSQFLSILVFAAASALLFYRLRALRGEAGLAHHGKAAR